jgi:hypothetical protein
VKELIARNRKKRRTALDLAQLRPGPFILPDLVRFDDLDADRTADLATARLFTIYHQSLYLPLSIETIASFVNAREKTVQF